MSKKANAAIWLSFASLVTAMVIAGGVIFAWMASNTSVTGRGVGINVFSDPDGGVSIETINGYNPDDIETIYAGDIMDFGLKAVQDISGFKIRLDFQKRLDEWDAFIEEAWREDLISGQYRYREKDGFMERDFDIDGFLRKYFEKAEFSGLTENLREELIFEAKLRFLWYFAVKYNLLDHMTMEVTKINEQPLTEPVALTPENIDQAGMDRLFTYSADNWTSGFAAGTTMNVRLRFTNEDTLWIKIAEGDVMELYGGQDAGGGSGEGALYRVKLDPGIYTALSYNCYTFQQMGFHLTAWVDAG